MECITVREAQPGDGEALTRIHAEVAQYHVDLAPRYFPIPIHEGVTEELDGEVGATDGATLRLVAEAEGEVAGALVARLLPRKAGAKRQITPELGETRLHIEYLATAAACRRRGVGTRLVEAAEAWDAASAPPSPKRRRTTAVRSRFRSGRNGWATRSPP